MEDTIVYIDQSDVLPGKVDEVNVAIRALVELIQPNEPQLIAYSIYLDDSARRMSVVAVHPDTASMERHMEVGASGFRRFENLIELRSIDVYGSPSDKVRRQLDQKAQMLGAGVRITIHEPYAGLARLAKPPR